MTASHQLIPLKHRGQTGCVPSPSWPLGFGTAWHTPLLVRVLASPAPEPWPVPGVCREEGWKQGQCRELASQTGLSRGVCHPPPAHCYPCVSCGKNNPVAAQRAGECAQVQGWKHEDRGGMLGSGDGLAVPPQHPPAARSEPVLPFPAKAGTGAGSAYATWSRVKYLSGCLMEKQAPLLLQLGGGERAHKHGKEVTRPCLPLGREPWPPPGPSPGCRGGGVPGVSKHPSLGSPRCPSFPRKGTLCHRGGWGIQGQGCSLQPALPHRAGTQRTSNFGPQTGASSCIQAGPRGAGVNRGAGKSLGACWCGGCMDWFHSGPTLPSSSPHRSCNRRHPPCKRCPKTRGKVGEGARQERSRVGTGDAERRSNPIQTHRPSPLGYSLFGGAEGGRISPSSHLTHGSALCCRREKKKKQTNFQGPKHILQPQAVTNACAFQVQNGTPPPQNNPKPLGFSGWSPHHPSCPQPPEHSPAPKASQ